MTSSVVVTTVFVDFMFAASARRTNNDCEVLAVGNMETGRASCDHLWVDLGLTFRLGGNDSWRKVSTYV